MNKLAAVVLGIGLLGTAVAQPGRWGELSVLDSLRQMPRWEQVRWLAKRGLPDPYLRDLTPVTDSGLRCIGRWSFGPSTWVDVRATADDTIVFLSRGSGVSVIRFRSQDSLRLDLLSDINSHGLTGRCQVRDTLLYVNSGGVECYDISNLTSPVLLNWLSQPLMYDFFVVDTLLYTSSRDSFRIFSVANPASPSRLGACADSGFVMFVTGGYAYLGHQYGLFILDVSNPASPHRVATLGYDVLSVCVQDTLLCFGTTEFALRVYNVKNPAAPIPVGSLSGIEAHDLNCPSTCDTVLYTPKLHVISIADPRNPRQVGFVDCPGWDYGVAAVPALNYALVADHFDGLVAVTIENPASPVVDTQQYAAEAANDVYIQAGVAYVAEGKAGMRILDVTEPTHIVTLGGMDTLFDGVLCPSVAARDSFAFMGMSRPWFRSIDVTDPARPLMAGACAISTEAQDMQVRDSLVYAASNYEFNIVNVARPRQPQVVGTLSLPDYSYGMCLRDTLAYVGTYPLEIISIASPTAPRVVGSIPRAGNVDVQDTIAYVAGGNGLFTYSVADPAAPYEIDSLGLNSNTFDVVVADRFAYVSTRTALFLVDEADPRNPRIIAQHPLPSYGWRVEYSPPYVYVAAQDAGVCIFETTAVGIAETGQRVVRIALEVRPNPVRDYATVRLSMVEADIRSVRLYDMSGRLVLMARVAPNAGEFGLDMTALSPGLYVARIECKDQVWGSKIVKK